MVGNRRWFVCFTPAVSRGPGGPRDLRPAGGPRGSVSGQSAVRPPLARRGPHARRTHLCRSRPRRPARHFLLRLGRRRRVEDRKFRPHLVPDRPIEGIPIGSIGAIAVAPSNPNIVYVGTGEPDIRSQHSYGIGMYKSIDAGKTWTHIGLEGTRQIGRVVVDPANPNRVYVAALGHVYAANPRSRRLSLDRWRRHLEKSSLQATTQIRRRRRSRASIPRIRACSTLRCGPRAVRRGRFTRRATCPAAGCTNPPMAATPGSS